MSRAAPPDSSVHDRAAYQDFLLDVLAEFRKVGQTLNDLHERIGRIETGLINIAEKQTSSADHDHRLTVIEERLTSLATDMVRQVEHKRWLIGIIMVLAGAVFSQMLPHLRWR